MTISRKDESGIGNLKKIIFDFTVKERKSDSSEISMYCIDFFCLFDYTWRLGSKNMYETSKGK